MTASTPSAIEPERPDVHLVEISIYLFNPSTSPSLINPDFLRYNEIVEPSWAVIRPVAMDAGSSRINYSNGLSLYAGSAFVSISQRADTNPERTTVTPLTYDEIVCFRVAKQYLDSVSPRFPYEMVSIDPTALIEMPSRNVNTLVSPLQSLAASIPFQEIIPEVQARVQYTFSDKEIVIYASEITPQGTDYWSRLQFGGEIIRHLEADDPQVQVETIGEVLDGWQQDVRDFAELTSQFYSMYIQKER